MPEGGSQSSERVITRVCVYCASSQQADERYYADARSLGRQLAERGIELVYGGGSVGSMGALADAALAAGGRVIGVLPQFMDEREWGHPGLSELRLVADMHERKRLMIEAVDAIVALPGATGTFEELLEALTWKRLGLHEHPIVIVNTGGFYDDLLRLLERSIAENFMDAHHRSMWSVVDDARDVLAALESAPAWRSLLTAGDGNE